MFLRSVCLVPLDFSAIPVSISAASLRRLTTYILLDFKVAKWAVSSLTHFSNPSSKYVYFKNLDSNTCMIFKLSINGKDIRKKRHQIFKLPNLCGNQLISTKLLLSLFLLFLLFGEKFPTAEF